MLFQGTLISVSDMERAKKFYQEVMEQKILMDLGVHVAFERGFSMQSNYEELVGEKLSPKDRPDNFQLYFEVDDLDAWQEKLQHVEGIEFLHTAKAYPWGQRGFRIYDFDKYIIEISESMKSVAKRFVKQGFTVEQTAEKMMSPVEYVKSLVEN